MLKNLWHSMPILISKFTSLAVRRRDHAPCVDDGAPAEGPALPARPGHAHVPREGVGCRLAAVLDAGLLAAGVGPLAVGEATDGAGVIQVRGGRSGVWENICLLSFYV